GPQGPAAPRRLERADQYRARDALALADEIDAPVHPVGAIDVSVAGRAEHRGVAGRAPAETMCGRVLVVIGLDLDDQAAHAVDEKLGSDQIGSDVMYVAGEERGEEKGRFGHRRRRSAWEGGWIRVGQVGARAGIRLCAAQKELRGVVSQ